MALYVKPNSTLGCCGAPCGLKLRVGGEEEPGSEKVTGGLDLARKGENQENFQPVQLDITYWEVNKIRLKQRSQPPCFAGLNP